MAKSIISYDQDLPEIPIETKGRVWEGTEIKDAAIGDWCDIIIERTGNVWKFFRINPTNFNTQNPKTLSEMIKPSNPHSNTII